MGDQLAADDQETQKQMILTTAHSEDVTRWTAAIVQCLQAAPDCLVSIAQLSQSLQTPWVEMWLGVLSGGFQLEQRGEFYSSPVWVKLPWI
jgi:hypothetical protein